MEKIDEKVETKLRVKHVVAAVILTLLVSVSVAFLTWSRNNGQTIVIVTDSGTDFVPLNILDSDGGQMVRLDPQVIEHIKKQRLGQKAADPVTGGTVTIENAAVPGVAQHFNIDSNTSIVIIGASDNSTDRNGRTDNKPVVMAFEGKNAGQQDKDGNNTKVDEVIVMANKEDVEQLVKHVNWTSVGKEVELLAEKINKSEDGKVDPNDLKDWTDEFQQAFKGWKWSK